ncbi:alpha/beta fold hydrolase [Sphingosinicella sp. CPCC 101087]|uniref:alpha/beta fold hydrolase n=1 Tax=Sphingosinicella sp. CPCC 101087 TaxID=2497754 RepID=UPI00101D6555|nr:alpha/beta hydrolase [Sphingosinicella sp. CPCC 101087]
MGKLLFLPGAGASADFWKPVAERLPGGDPAHFFAWPGLGDEPAQPQISGIDDLVAMVVEQMDRPCDLVAQSMGALVAILAALTAPAQLRSLVLCATSGGVPVDDLGGTDWRADYRREFPGAAPWITEIKMDLSDQIGAITAPALVLVGDRDPISPPAVGERLSRLLPHARLQRIRGGGHDLARTHADQVATLIAEHLGRY